MPLQAGNLPTELTMSITDFNAETSTTSVFFPTSFSVLEVNNNVAEFEAVIAALTDGFVASAGISRRFVQDAQPDANNGGASSNVQRKGVFVFANSFGTTNTYYIPSIDRSLVIQNSDAINVNAPAVAAYVSFMTAGLIPIVGSRPVGGNGYQLTRLIRAYEDSVDKPDSRRR